MVHVIGLGERHDPLALALETKSRKHIQNERRRQLAPTVMAAHVGVHTAAYPGIQPRSASSEYNCVGMVFASRRTWIDADLVEWILHEDGYRRVDARDVFPGDVIVYRREKGKVAHVGLVYLHNARIETADWHTKVLSQWGGDGEFFHDAHEVPALLGEPTEFWTDRSRPL